MMQRLLIILLLLIAPLYNVKSQKAVQSEPNYLVENFDYFFHTVERGQTVYSIATMYKVSQEDIYRLNPGSREVIKIGEQLKIPQVSGSYFFHTIQPKETLYSVSKLYQMRGEDIVAVNPGLSVETFTIGKIIRIPTNKVTKPIEGGNETYNKVTTNNLLVPDTDKKNIEMLKVALLLPFGLKEGTAPANATGNRYVEYYEGFLLALQDLKKKGVNISLQVYDTGSGTGQIQSILDKDKMKKVNLIIGGQNDAQIKMLSRFSAANKIPYVIPFTSQSDEPLNNYYSYQINTPHPYLYSKTAQAFAKQHKNDNIIFYTPSSTGNKMDFVETMKQELDSRKISYQSISDLTGLSGKLSRDKKNLFLFGDDTKESLSKVMAAINTFKENNPSYDFSLFGHPSWQIYSSEMAGDFYSLNASFYSIFFFDPALKKTKNFHQRYNRWYSREMINKVPKYGILGYDTGMYFLQLLDKYGSAYDANVNGIKYSGIQTDFYFERINNWGGFINTNIFFVEFKPNYKINSKNIK